MCDGCGSTVPAAVRPMSAAMMELPYEGVKEMLLVDDVDNREFLCELIESMWEDLPEKKKRKNENSLVQIFEPVSVLLDIGRFFIFFRFLPELSRPKTLRKIEGRVLTMIPEVRLMTTFTKNGIEVCMPEDDEKSRQNMIVAAEFMARMIQKYGKRVLVKIEEKERMAAGDQSEKVKFE